MSKSTLLCIVGPTACHKTEVSILLAKAMDGEIISADSVQVYTGMDIGSAKPTERERMGIPHHMIDCVPIDTPSFSVVQYRSMAAQAIEGVISRGKRPIVVGGSGLYVQALTSPLEFAIPSDPVMRAYWNSVYEASPEDAVEQLAKCDPPTAQRLHLNDKKRIVRALEVYACSGKPLSAYGNDFNGTSTATALYPSAILGLKIERAALVCRIHQRVDEMMRQGLLDEVERLWNVGYPRTLPAMQSIGYKQLFSYLDGDCTLEMAVAQIKQDTSRFAKRQMTWFRRDERIQWIDVTAFNNDKLSEIEQTAKEMLQE